MERLEHEGYWWLPGNQDQAVAGKLVMEPNESPMLLLEGTLTRLAPTMDNMSDKPVEIIQGVTRSGEPITLERCYMAQTTFGTGYVTSAYIATFIFTGNHFATSSELRFNRFSVEFTDIAEFARMSGFGHHTEKTEHSERQIYSYEFPKDIVVQMNGYQMKLTFRTQTSSKMFSEITIQQRTMFAFDYPEPVHYSEFLNGPMYHIQNFISLGLGHAVKPISIRVQNDDVVVELGDKQVHREINIYFKHRPINETGAIHPSHMLFTLPILGQRFEKCITNWFSRSEQIKPVYDLYFSSVYAPMPYIDFDFLILAQAIESYHRRARGGKFMPDDDYPPLRDAITNAIPSTIDADFRQSLQERIKYGNEYSLRKRLKDLLKELTPYVTKYIPEPKAFIERTVAARNYLTHYEGDESSRNVATLIYLTERLRMLMQVIFLLEMGLEEQEVLEILTKTHKFNHLEND